MKAKSKERIILTGIAILFLMLNIILFKVGSHGDVWKQQEWGNHALEKGINSIYTDRVTDYPPLYLYVLKFNAWLNHRLSNYKELLKLNHVFISKTIPTLANLIIGLTIFYYFRKKSKKKAIIAMCLYLFNPAIIYNTAYWGQVDSVQALFMFLGILFLIKKRYTLSTLFIVSSVLTKLQSIILMPILALVLIMNFDLKIFLKTLFINLGVFVITLLPFILAGTLPHIINVLKGSVGRYPYLTANAYNFWFLISPKTPNYMDTLRDTHIIFGISLKTIGLILLGIYILLALYQIFRKSNIALGAASMAFAFFMLPTQIHERYLFPFFALFLLIPLNKKKHIWIYVILSITFLLNLMIVFSFKYKPFFVFYLIQVLINKLTSLTSLKAVAISIAIINILVFIYFNKIGIFNNFIHNLKKDYKRIKKIENF